MPTGFCSICDRASNSTAHRETCMSYITPDPLVKCVVPGCFVWTRKPTRDGLCPIEIWSEDHDAYFAALVERRSA